MKNCYNDKIILISDLHPASGVGGGQLITYEYFSRLEKLNLDVEFWYTSQLNSVDKSSLVREVRFISKTKGKFLNEIIGQVNLLKFVSSIIKNKGAKIWINQIGIYWPFTIFLILRFLQFKVIFTFHDYLVISKYKSTNLPSGNSIESKLNSLNLTSFQKLRFYFIRFCINRSNTNIAISQLQSEVLSSLGLRIDYVIPNGIDNCVHSTAKKSFNNKNNLQILFAGRPLLKGLDILIKCISNSKYDWNIHLAGDLELLEYAKDLSIGKYVYHGPLPRYKLFDLYHQVDVVFVCSQYLDPGPLIGVEALKHGTPFISTKLCGSSSIFTNELANRLIIESHTLPDLDSTFDFIEENYFKIISVRKNIMDISQVLQLYLNLLK
jgi:glycosyltransferase involved in cell wall biosynthesis